MSDSWIYGWKEIANWINVSTETAKRYCEKYDLPVRRGPTGKPVMLQKEGTEWINKYRGDGKTFVYFIQCPVNGFIKIGYTTNVKHRFKNLKAGSPVELEMIGYIYGSKKVEESLHKRFKRYRKHGEWFEPSKPLMSFLEKQEWLSGDM